MNWFITRSRLWESAVLLACCFALFRPGWWLDLYYPSHVERPATELLQRVERAEPGERMIIVVEGVDIEGDDVRKTVSLQVGDRAEPRARLRAIGLTVLPAGDKIAISNVAFGSYAKRTGLEAGYNVVAVLEPAQRPSRIWPALGGLIVAAGIAGLQWRRRQPALAPA